MIAVMCRDLVLRFDYSSKMWKEQSSLLEEDCPWILAAS
jgi:hypothetical protein